MSRIATRTTGTAAVFLIFVLVGSAFGQAERRYDGHSIVRITAKDQAEIDRIEATGGIILNCIHGPGELDVVVSADQLAELGRLGIEAAVVEHNVQQAIEAQKAPRLAVAGAGDPYDDFFLAYHPYEGDGGIVWYMNELVARYPALASMVNIGTTLEGRTIWGVRITAAASPDTPGVLYFSAEHAREWITPPVALFFARHLLDQYGSDAEVTDLVDSVEFFVVPVFNADGYVFSWTSNRFWRKNRRPNSGGTFGVDVNRNWGTGWGGAGSSGTSSSEVYRGTSAFSEPETQAMRDFILARPNLRAQLDIHSYSQLILWPYGYTPALPPDQEYYQDVGLDMQSLIQGVHGRFYVAGPANTTIYPASGVSIDWTYAQRDMLSLTVECRDTGTFGFLLPPEQIIPNCEEMLPAMLRMTNSDWVREPVRFQFPDGLPASLRTGESTTILVEIVEQTQFIEPASASVHFRYDPAGGFTQSTMSALGGGFFEAALPATNCTSEPQFYFSVQTMQSATSTNPMTAGTGTYYAAAMQSDDRVGVCDGLFADHNGDGAVDSVDFAAFEDCFSGKGNPAGPGCAIFDANQDDAVDCHDWFAFFDAWTDEGSAPGFESCPMRAAPGLVGAGARYITVSGLTGDEPLAIHVSSPDLPCLSAYVDLDEGAANPPVGRLVDAPVYRLPSEWGDPLPVADEQIGPSMRFIVGTEDEMGMPSLKAEAQTLLWGDTSDPIGVLNILDVSGLKNCILELPGSPSLERCDLEPATPNRIANVLDLSQAVDALKEFDYPFPTDCQMGRGLGLNESNSVESDRNKSTRRSQSRPRPWRRQ